MEKLVKALEAKNISGIFLTILHIYVYIYICIYFP